MVGEVSGGMKSTGASGTGAGAGAGVAFGAAISGVAGGIVAADGAGSATSPAKAIVGEAIGSVLRLRTVLGRGAMIGCATGSATSAAGGSTGAGAGSTASAGGFSAGAGAAAGDVRALVDRVNTGRSSATGGGVSSGAGASAGGTALERALDVRMKLGNSVSGSTAAGAGVTGSGSGADGTGAFVRARALRRNSGNSVSGGGVEAAGAEEPDGTCIAFNRARNSSADDDAAVYDAATGDSGGAPAAGPGTLEVPLLRRKAGSSGGGVEAAPAPAAGAPADSVRAASVAEKVDRASSTGRLVRELPVGLPTPVVLPGAGVAADPDGPVRDVLRNGGSSGVVNGAGVVGGVDRSDSPGVDRLASADEKAARASSTGLDPAPFFGSGRFRSSPDDPVTLRPAIVIPFLATED